MTPASRSSCKASPTTLIMGWSSGTRTCQMLMNVPGIVEGSPMRELLVHLFVSPRGDQVSQPIQAGSCGNGPTCRQTFSTFRRTWTTAERPAQPPTLGPWLWLARTLACTAAMSRCRTRLAKKSRCDARGATHAGVFWLQARPALLNVHVTHQ